METNKQAPAARKEWNKDEWAAKARERDAESAAHAKAAEEAMKAGRKYKPHEDMPKPTKLAQQRGNLDLDKDTGKTTLVQTTSSSTGPRGPGFYCDLCNRTLKDSLSYLDHLNSRFHLSKLGQSTYVERSTVAQVRERIRQLREESKTKVDAKNYDFARRLGEVRDAEKEKREKRKEDKKRKRAERREQEILSKVGVDVKAGASADEVQRAVAANDSIEAMMGFGGFGSTKRK